ncbi:hypothetical protein [Cupriavidus sp. PET2-C1]
MPSSADWMGRNLFRRIEVCFSLTKKRLKIHIIDEGLKLYEKDKGDTWDMTVNGTYRRRRGRAPFAAQDPLLRALAA